MPVRNVVPDAADGLGEVTSVDHPATGISCLDITNGTPPSDHLVGVMQLGLYEPVAG